MSDTTLDDPDLQDPDEQRDAAGLTPAERRVLQRERDEARAEVQRLTRAGAVRDAGLELNERQTKALEATHEGDWTPEALRQTAVDLGFAQAPPPDVPADELAAQQRMAQAAQGGQVRPPDVEADIDARLREAAARGDQAEFDRIYRESGRPLAQ